MYTILLSYFILKVKITLNYYYYITIRYFFFHNRAKLVYELNNISPAVVSYFIENKQYIFLESYAIILFVGELHII